MGKNGWTWSQVVFVTAVIWMLAWAVFAAFMVAS